ncbi:MAG: ATP-binding protein [Thermoflexales bacterium]|nr:ATP-binding protein [Thermoflexales bacterium]
MRELSLHILDILENSLAAGATWIELTIEEDLAADSLTITVEDDGRGMSQEQLARVLDPFYTTRTTRRVGLGLPLFKAAAERCNGSLAITSQAGLGTTVQVTFQRSHIDRAPLGDIKSTLMAAILRGTADIRYVHRIKREGAIQEFDFDTASIRTELDGVPLTHPPVQQWLQRFIAEGEKEIEISDRQTASSRRDRDRR